MFGKLCMIVVAATLTAIGLLVARHHRIELAHEMSSIHHRMIEEERALWELRGEIARRCRPEEVKRLLETLPIEWRPIPNGVDRPADPPRGPVAAATDDGPAEPAGG